MNRRIAGLVDALERGIVTPATKERLEALEAEKAALERAAPAPVLPAFTRISRSATAAPSRALRRS